MADLIPTDPQQVIQNNTASQQASTSQTAASALGNTKSAAVSSTPLVGDIGDDELVSGQLKKLIADDSPVMQQARERSRQDSASRGLQNSSIAAQAGEQAVISTAAPIAAQDASTISNRRSQNLATVNQFGQNQQQTESQKQLIQTQTDANSRLQLEQGNINERLQSLDQNFKGIQADLDRGAALTLEDKRFQTSQALIVSEYAQRSGLSSQEAAQEVERLNAGHKNTMEQIAAQTKADVAPKLQAQYLSAVNDRMMAASNEIQQIYSTQGLKADQQNAAVAKARAQLQSDLSQLQAYYQASPLWDPAWGTTPQAGAGATDTGGGFGGYDNADGNLGQLISGMP